MGGLAVLLFIGLYIAGTVWVVKAQKSKRAKIIALVIVLLIPSADAILGRIYLQHLCDTEGGLKVYRVVEGVEGFMDYNNEYWVKKGGYQFSESFPIDGKVTRYIRQDGQIIREENVMPISQYRVILVHIGKPHNIYLRNRFVIETIPAGKVLAMDTQIAFNGGWVERFLAQFSDAGGGAVAWCTGSELNPIVRHERLVHTVLEK